MDLETKMSKIKEKDWNRILMSRTEDQIFWEIVSTKPGNSRHGDVGYFQLKDNELETIVVKDVKTNDIFEITLKEFYSRYDTSKKGDGIELTFAPEDNDHYYVINDRLIDVFTEEEFTFCELRDFINKHYGKFERKLELPITNDEINVEEVIGYFSDKFPPDKMHNIQITKDFLKLTDTLVKQREKLIAEYAKRICTYLGISNIFLMTDEEVKTVLDKYNITLE